MCRRAKNREAARRSRERKNERIRQLTKDISSLQQENLLLLKCIEAFAEKVIACKHEQLAMQEELDIHSTASKVLESASVGVDGAGGTAGATAPQAAGHRGVHKITGFALPALEELWRLQAAEPSQLTARGQPTSARGAAVAEHIAILSKENSPRDEEEAAPTVAGATPTAQGAVAEKALNRVSFLPDPQATHQQAGGPNRIGASIPDLIAAAVPDGITDAVKPIPMDVDNHFDS